MQKLVEKYLDKNADLHILDVGSYNVNGTYKKLFDNPKWKYVGADIGPGPNVDMVIDENGVWSNITDNAYDAVICGQVLEHTKEPQKLALAIARVCKVNGYCFVIAPWKFGPHPFPKDYWRILPDGMEFIFMDVAGLAKLECYMSGVDTVFAGTKVKRYG
jgi:SAM-dependent methyltransferase